jgi:hypothetical protein
LADCEVVDPPLEWNEVISWFKAMKSRNSLKIAICKLCLGAVVYHLWKRRNDILHGNPPLSEEDLVSQIKRQIRAWLLAKGSVKMVGDRFGLIQAWNLYTLIRC